MTSHRERQQREAARARLAREMTERQAAAKKRRQQKIAAGGAAALLLVVVGTVWAVTALTGDDDEPLTPAAGATPTTSATAGPSASPSVDPADLTHPGECAWQPPPPDDERVQLVEVGTPPDDVEPQDATQELTVSTNYGDIVVEMDLAVAPCIAASFAHLAEHDFYDNVKCHRAFEGVLQCGDPFVTADDEFGERDGTGGPDYRFPDENLPVGQQPPYPRGTMAMANVGPDTNGGQFFFVHQDQEFDGPKYGVIGTIVEGLDALEEIGAEGTYHGDYATRPNAEVVISDVTVGEPQPYESDS